MNIELILKTLGADPEKFKDKTDEEIVASASELVDSWKTAAKNDDDFLKEMRRKHHAEAHGATLGSLTTSMKRLGFSEEKLRGIEKIQDIEMLLGDKLKEVSSHNDEAVINENRNLQAAIAKANEALEALGNENQELKDSIPTIKEEAFISAKRASFFEATFLQMQKDGKIQGSANSEKLAPVIEKLVTESYQVQYKDGNFSAMTKTGNDPYEGNTKMTLKDIIFNSAKDLGIDIKSSPTQKANTDTSQKNGKQPYFKGKAKQNIAQ
jgi:Holliday junction resolvasome RuvABC DNA-binding subunit